MIGIRSEQRREVWKSFAAYQEYVLRNKELFPENAYLIATSGWWYTLDDHRCPHDAALEQCAFTEVDDRSGVRSLNIDVRLISAHYCGIIHISYPHVMSYTLESRASRRGMRDWFSDRFFLSKQGGVVHDIKWEGRYEKESCGWHIEASDVKVAWIPDDPRLPKEPRRA
jgi:hypothetical protein